MASINKRGGYWRAQVRVKGHSSLSRTFDSKAQAQTWARDVQSQMERGLYRNMAEAECRRFRLFAT